MTEGQARDEIHWTVTATPAPECRQLDGRVEVDALVVGGGLTGCRTALGLAEAGTSVALVDGARIGWGASGRSGGQANPIWRQTPDELIEKLGRNHGERLVRTTLTAAQDLFADIARFGIDCDAVQSGWLQAAHSRKARDRMRLLGRAWAAAGMEIEELEGDALRRASGSSAYGFALRHAAGGHVQPLSLTRGYARAAITRGVQAFENAPISRLERVNGKWHAHAPGGVIVAENVVLATNAYSKGLWPDLHKTYYGLFSIAIVTRPLSETEQQEILPGKVTISDSRLAIYFARYDRDGRLIFGCVGSGERVGQLGGFQRLKRGLRTVFPQIAGIAIERKWAGRIAVTPEMMPHMHEPAPGVLAGLGYSGRGIVMTSVMGRALAARLLGTPPGDLPFPALPIRPIPFHGLVSRLIPLAAPAMTLRDRLDTLTDGL
ncbi:MAG: FAD-binding oxidoreductase [Alphaproteobacteria bacterium]|nr:MAG: FAD-binding oxidoreductase [Alphaproteobacteria bacterium]